MNWMLLPLKRYADFSGRSRRKEYWMFMLAYMLALFIGWGLMVAAGRLGVVALGLGFLALIIPSMAVQVRRFHDQDRSGWMLLLNFVPYVGGLIVLFFMIRKGTDGPNRFGPDPIGLNGELAEVFA